MQRKKITGCSQKRVNDFMENHIPRDKKEERNENVFCHSRQYDLNWSSLNKRQNVKTMVTKITKEDIHGLRETNYDHHGFAMNKTA